jgi:hypothetical protein
LAVPIGEIEPDPGNPVTHGEENLSAIEASFRRFGQREPLVVNRLNRRIEAGHGRLIVARRLGWTHVAVLWVEDDPAAERGYRLADNRTAELAEWDLDTLAALVAGIRDADADLAAALLLDDLVGEVDPPADAGEKPDSTAGGAPEQEVPSVYKAIVTCRDQADQTDLIERLQREGFQCRALTL